MFYLFLHDYRPGDAATNRFMAYVKYLSGSRIPATVVFPYPSPQRDRVEQESEGVTFRYLWSPQIRHRPFRTINLLLRNFLLKCRIKKGDTVFLYGLSELMPQMCRLQGRGVKVFHERTENPELFRLDGTLGHPSAEEYYSLCAKADRIFVITRALKNFFAGKGVPQDRITIVNMIVDDSRFDGLVKNCDARLITYCGSLSNNAKDGIDRLIKAFAIISRSHPEARLQLIGRIPARKEEQGNLDLIRQLSLEDKVILPGFVRPEDMAGKLKNSTVLVLPRPESTQAEYGFPTKLGEYLSSGNPVVASAVGEIPLFLKDGENAVLARPGDENDLAEKIIRLLDNPGGAAEIGLRGAACAQENFNWKKESAKIFG